MLSGSEKRSSSSAYSGASALYKSYRRPSETPKSTPEGKSPSNINSIFLQDTDSSDPTYASTAGFSSSTGSARFREVDQAPESGSLTASDLSVTLTEQDKQQNMRHGSGEPSDNNLKQPRSKDSTSEPKSINGSQEQNMPDAAKRPVDSSGSHAKVSSDKSESRKGRNQGSSPKIASYHELKTPSQSVREDEDFYGGQHIGKARAFSSKSLSGDESSESKDHVSTKSSDFWKSGPDVRPSTVGSSHQEIRTPSQSGRETQLDDEKQVRSGDTTQSVMNERSNSRSEPASVNDQATIRSEATSVERLSESDLQNVQSETSSEITMMADGVKMEPGTDTKRAQLAEVSGQNSSGSRRDSNQYNEAQTPNAGAPQTSTGSSNAASEGESSSSGTYTSAKSPERSSNYVKTATLRDVNEDFGSTEGETTGVTSESDFTTSDTSSDTVMNPPLKEERTSAEVRIKLLLFKVA